MSRILAILPTTSYRPTALNAAARALGVELVVASDRRQALEHATDGTTLTLDFADLDGAVAVVREHARRHGLDGVLGCDDETTEVAAVVARSLGLRGHAPEAVRTASNKARTREALRRAGLPGPRFDLFDLQHDPQGIATTLRFPCVLKPTFLSASRGVMRADDADDFVVKYHRLARILSDSDVIARGGEEARRVLVEDYLPGCEVAVEGLVTEGRLRVLAIFDKPDPLEGPFFQETLYITPDRQDRETRAAIETATAQAVRALGLDDGPIHAELRVRPGSAVVLEVAPRSIGGRCGRVLELSTGTGVEEIVLRHQLGQSIDARIEGAAGVLMIPIPTDGVLERVDGIERVRELPDIEGAEILISPGEAIAPPPEGHRYLGFVFARSADPAAAERALRAAAEAITVRVR